MVQPMRIPLGSLDSRSNPVREFGKAQDLKNIDFDILNEPEKRKGYVRRLSQQRSGPIRLLFSYGGLCGRFPQFVNGGGLLLVSDEATGSGVVGAPGGAGGGGGIWITVPAADEPTIPLAIQSFGVVRSDDDAQLAWDVAQEALDDGGYVEIRVSGTAFPETLLDGELVVRSTEREYLDTDANIRVDNYYTAWLVVEGQGVSDAVTSLLGAHRPAAEGFAANVSGDSFDEVTLSWLYEDASATLPSGAVGVIIRADTTAAPATSDSGRLVYSGPGVTVTDLLANTSADIFYSIWVNYGASGESERETAVAVGVERYYAISFITDLIERGTAYAMKVTAYNPDGAIATSYTPASDPTITLENGDPNDNIAPTNLGTSGWVNGSKTVDVTVTGGSGVDPTDLVVKEGLAIGRETLIVITTAGFTEYVQAFTSGAIYLAGEGHRDAEEDDCSSDGKLFYVDVQNLTRAELRADISLVGITPFVQTEVVKIGTFINVDMTAVILRTLFSISNVRRDGAQAAFLRGNLFGGIQNVNGVKTYTTETDFYRLKLDVDYTGNKHPIGASMYDAVGLPEWPMSELNQLLVQRGGTPGTGEEVDFAIPLSWISNMPSTTIYIWTAIIFDTMVLNLSFCNDIVTIASRLDPLSIVTLE